MVDLHSLFTIGHFVAGAMAGLATAMAWQYRSEPCGFPLFLASASVGLFSTFRGLVLLVDEQVIGYGLLLASESVILFATIAWFYIAVEYTGRTTFKRPAVLSVIGLIVIGDLLVVGLDPIHHLYFGGIDGIPGREIVDPVGPMIYVRLGLSMILGALFYGLFIDYYRTTSGVYRRQSLAIMAGSSFALLFGILEVVTEYDVVTFGVVSGSIGMLWAIFWADFLEVNPIARKTLMENMEDAVIALDTADRITDINPRAQLLFGIDETAVGEPASTVLASFPGLVSSLDTDQASKEITIETDESDRHYHLNISPVTNDTEAGGRIDRSVIGRIIVLRDITENERRRRELERQNERLDRFATVVSHDLRNPLTIAQGNLDLAMEVEDLSYLETVGEAHARMETMIDELLTMARADSTVEHTETVRLETVVTLAWQTVDTDGAVLDSELPDGWCVECDPDLLGHVFVNLFRNAIDHNDDPVTITVGTLSDRRGFYVADDGVGIPPEKRERIFEQGYTSNRSGLGVGLSIVLDVINAHEWAIEVTDAKTGGTRFEIDVE